jgi:hypothetical protein
MTLIKLETLTSGKSLTSGKTLTSGLNQRPAVAYSPEILPLMQSLLRALADIDFNFERDLETVATSAIDEPLKQKAVTTLKQSHQERRAPYLREIASLQKLINAAA